MAGTYDHDDLEPEIPKVQMNGERIYTYTLPEGPQRATDTLLLGTWLFPTFS